MLLAEYLTAAVSLLVGALIVFRIVVRRDYQHSGRLSPISALLELVICILYFAFPYIYNRPDWAAFWSAQMDVGPSLRVIGSTLVMIGAMIAFPAMTALGFRRSFGQETNSLKQAGFYRATRNPQVIGGALMPIGIVVLFPSWYAVGWLILYAAIFHMMIITEEEHLHRIFGDEYKQYCRRVPRYFGFLRHTKEAN